jgi:hypothetical protein
MIFKSIIALSITIVRFFLFVKIISWIILEIIDPNKQSVTDIEVYLVALLLDLWLFSNVAEIVIREKED